MSEVYKFTTCIPSPFVATYHTSVTCEHGSTLYLAISRIYCIDRLKFMSMKLRLQNVHEKLFYKYETHSVHKRPHNVLGHS